MVTLPQNLLTNVGTLYEDFEADADWTAGAPGAKETNAIEYKTGTHSEKFSTAVGSNFRFYRTINTVFAGVQRIQFWFYLHNPLAEYGGSVLIQLANDAGIANYYRYYMTTDRFVAGWNFLNCPLDQWTVGGGAPNWANPMIRLRFESTAAAGKTAVVSFDSMMTGVIGVPAVILNFDDGTTVQYSDCFPYMKNRGVRGTFFVPSDYVGTGGYVTAAQLIKMQAADWTIGNHTKDHTNLTTLSEADMETNLSAAITAYAAIGIIDGPQKYVAYPGGAWNADVLTAMTNLGMRIGRTSASHTNVGYNNSLPCNLYTLAASTVTNTTTVATVTGWIDTAIANGTIVPLTFHQIGAGSDMTLADFKLVIDYIVAKSRAGKIQIITMNDLYKLTLGPISVPALT
jgi:peptidoglycan/xylan/chitin deacetylase (PgdA/CDA1 family)